jgi:hypothetical protein
MVKMINRSSLEYLQAKSTSIVIGYLRLHIYIGPIWLHRSDECKDLIMKLLNF